ncbi:MULTISPECIES: hypothetical protein [Thermaceae]|uniref:Uncharacterized protein n=2 Tax=Thermaceae TaxID=188786 RepID=D7BA25_ALLS1|nr:MULTISPECIES: hypothetical protein [Thermaceae]ADH62459.1 hypothetical protein Mesil_0526 [Allomeiothermus silvanus DSM 9946]GEM84928.1 hypothetical protein MHY01S_30940 [Meiothermus hypogaeus NBRC 106114]
MSKAIVRRESRVVTYFDLAPEASPDDVLSFLRLVFAKTGEELRFEAGPDYVSVDYSGAPEAWRLVVEGMLAVREGKLVPQVEKAPDGWVRMSLRERGPMN